MGGFAVVALASANADFSSSTNIAGTWTSDILLSQAFNRQKTQARRKNGKHQSISDTLSC